MFCSHSFSLLSPPAPYDRPIPLFPLSPHLLCPSYPFIPNIGCFEPPGCCGAGEGAFQGGGVITGGLQPGHPQRVPSVCQSSPLGPQDPVERQRGSAAHPAWKNLCCCTHPVPTQPPALPDAPAHPGDSPSCCQAVSDAPQPRVSGSRCCWVTADPLSLSGLRG